MKKIPFKKAEFLTSALKSDELPDGGLPEIAIVGRSNVGKSSLINHLLRSKMVAKVSSTPGKTQRINYFVIDDALLLVDLPGYGYAKTSKSLQEEWGLWIEKYLKERSLKLILFLVDSRRELTLEDRQFLEWADYHQTPLLLIATKGDKLNQKEKGQALKRLEGEKSLSRFPPLLYSIKEGKCREMLIHEINRAL
ncbi:ribosome biogenesis GTP-binding protein YihA/YsxC [Candidatus Neptunochlamydia vexilliferae]|uniref:Probable GTP-binding protein EngB n=1 Tax=Candidatus Neptunichlamydia vexilliferae TaxID=1651774 RepID=A0ABS0AX60_9BACT|nr:ribosome biogenesis GTP-binding protein YihA/YsxC [Candidatus Neptunochlamydia vexilliferae]MBF5058729.1 putative GTP-binding protein EngB [Candidatus Neptunochlamydia vexilliferae]